MDFTAVVITQCPECCHKEYNNLSLLSRIRELYRLNDSIVTTIQVV